MAYGDGLFNGTGAYQYQAWNGQKRGNGGSAASYGSSWTAVGDVIGLAFDADNGKIYFGESDENNNILSLWNDKAEHLVDQIGMDSFKLQEPGTAIMIVGFEPSDGEEYETEIIVQNIKNAVGAGDAFCAGFIFGIHEEWDIETTLKKSHAAGSAMMKINTSSGNLPNIKKL